MKAPNSLELQLLAVLDGRPSHGYRISQLFSSKVDPGEILNEYRATRYPDRFYNLKIGIPWADLERRLDEMTVLALCRDETMQESCEKRCTMGVDTGKELHVVISRWKDDSREQREVIYVGTRQSYADLL